MTLAKFWSFLFFFCPEVKQFVVEMTMEIEMTIDWLYKKLCIKRFEYESRDLWTKGCQITYRD